MIKITLRIGLAALVLIGSLNSAALAQGLFDPVISVNRAAITAYSRNFTAFLRDDAARA